MSATAAALLVVPVVASGIALLREGDSDDPDAAYSGTQKCLSVPPGLSPLHFGRRALDALSARFARTRAPFLSVEPATRWSVPAAPMDDALRRLRVLIPRYNRQTGRSPRERAGYREDTTRHWVGVIDAHVRAHRSAPPDLAHLFRSLCENELHRRAKRA